MVGFGIFLLLYFVIDIALTIGLIVVLKRRGYSLKRLAVRLKDLLSPPTDEEIDDGWTDEWDNGEDVEIDEDEGYEEFDDNDSNDSIDIIEVENAPIKKRVTIEYKVLDIVEVNGRLDDAQAESLALAISFERSMNDMDVLETTTKIVK